VGVVGFEDLKLRFFGIIPRHFFCSYNIVHTTFNVINELFCSQLHNASAKFAFQMSTVKMIRHEAMCQTGGLVLANEMRSEAASMGFDKHNIMNELLAEVMLRLVASGIPEYLYVASLWKCNDHFEPPEDELLRIFSMGDLEYGFALWLGACAVSTLVFFGEVLNVKSRRFVANLAGLVEFLSAIVELTRRYHDRW
jgi:hypothetical protein